MVTIIQGLENTKMIKDLVEKVDKMHQQRISAEMEL